MKTHQDCIRQARESLLLSDIFFLLVLFSTIIIYRIFVDRHFSLEVGNDRAKDGGATGFDDEPKLLHSFVSMVKCRPRRKVTSV
jgi:hypothetical protein